MTIEIEPREGFAFTVEIVPDDGRQQPWAEEDGHGPVSDWRSADSKSPGELVLCEDRGSALFYDFAEACRIALRDGWDAKPYNRDGRETPRQQAAKAARADYDRLRRFCAGEWGYVGVVVTASRDGIKLGSASLWGIESDCDDYLAACAEELADEALDEAKTKLAALCGCEAERN